MAKAIKILPNKLSIRYLKKAKKYFITLGVMHVRINDMYSDGFYSIEYAEDVAIKLKPTVYIDNWDTD